MYQKCVCGRGSAPDPAGGAYDAPTDPIVGWGGDTPSPDPNPRLDSRAFGARYSQLRHLTNPIVTTEQMLMLKTSMEV